jgi:hypothetical protein
LLPGTKKIVPQMKGQLYVRITDVATHESFGNKGRDIEAELNSFTYDALE